MSDKSMKNTDQNFQNDWQEINYTNEINYDADFLKALKQNQEYFEKCLQHEAQIYNISNNDQINEINGQLNVIQQSLFYIQNNKDLKYVQFKDLIDFLTNNLDQEVKNNHQVINLQGAFIPSSSVRSNISFEQVDQQLEIGKQLKIQQEKI
ncbi:hypothetical protein TTHERM_00113220 (macronuclear) [Tetrahymena thermophila SB210]|uniref:Uncharacterized protein n=1 Tax=Tetrahymena thermophila (strain SB210) TaxID=312017 RepID=Q22Z49_TETTS|nr:hypothetical protein TTHERM_00113220 [Tetrahymena thermophila SB210]EAR90472.1 hypothetical protein TTHERM_00113220 [Tetrahymena thermophila SB210]|eukprot:XP_001010717.1 hypothetical protein TTHERM_00113220 [Tetrahymena thermophila SB210]